MPFRILSVRDTLGAIAPVRAGQTYIFTVPVSTRAGHTYWPGAELFVVEETQECPYDEIGASGHNWICRTQNGDSVWATLEQCISRGVLRLVPPSKELS